MNEYDNDDICLGEGEKVDQNYKKNIISDIYITLPNGEEEILLGIPIDFIDRKGYEKQ